MPTLYERDLSIIIPVYNLERFLGPMLESLKSQRHDYKVETIFVLNNCTDDSEGVIRRSGLDCEIMSCTTQGCGPARNTGLEAAKGERIWFMDGDDWLLSDTAIQDAMDAAQGLDILRIPFQSNSFRWQYFSMVWQYVIKTDLIGGTRFPRFQPAEDDAFMDEILAKVGRSRLTHMSLPCLMEPLYFYNYLREGSNMYRHFHGEAI